MSRNDLVTVGRRRAILLCAIALGCSGTEEQENPSLRQDQLSPMFVQANSALPQVARARVTQTYQNAQSAGNLNVVIIGWQDTSARVTSVTDSKGNAYRLAVGPTQRANSASQSIYYASNIAAAAPGANTVSVRFNTPARYADLRILEYAGIVGSSPLDRAIGTSGDSITSNTGVLNTTNANDLLVAGNVVVTDTASGDPNFTTRMLTSPNNDIVLDRVVSNVGAYSASARLTSSGPWVMQMAAFKAASSSGGSGGTGGSASTGGSKATGGSNATGGTTGAGGGLPSGWLYTSGNKVYVSNGNGSGSVWVGRGVNVDDLFFCGYNSGLWLSDPQGTFTTMIDGLMAGWKPDFLRVSLSMRSYDTVSWVSNPAQYKTPMTNVINHIGSYQDTYVLVTLRTDSSMGNVSVGDDATYYPTSTTDPTYRALVNTFANSKFVMFGISNEPGGNALSNTQIRNAMAHAVETIRAEEDRLGVPHHVIAVQGNSWTSDISFYATNPLPYDNVVYEMHSYPPAARDYTFSNLPVIIGEYGPPNLSTTNTSFFSAFAADIEAKQIPSLAWDFQPFSDCAPDLLNVTRSATNLQPNAWGNVVRDYLLSHAH